MLKFQINLHLRLFSRRKLANWKEPSRLQWGPDHFRLSLGNTWWLFLGDVWLGYDFQRLAPDGSTNGFEARNFFAKLLLQNCCWLSSVQTSRIQTHFDSFSDKITGKKSQNRRTRNSKNSKNYTLDSVLDFSRIRKYLNRKNYEKRKLQIRKLRTMNFS